MKINEHLEEYRKQLDQLRQQMAALQGAIQALERLQKEEVQNGDGKNSDTQ